MIPSCSSVGNKAGAGGGGGGAPTISLTNTSADAAATGSSSAGYSVKSDGTVTTNVTTPSHGTVATFFENWISDPAQAGNYEVKAVLSSGSTPSGVLGAYQALTSSRTWTLTNSAGDGSVVSAVLTVTIRKTGTATVLATATITLSAESD